MANLAINTTQNVNLDYKIVSVGERILGFSIDLLLFFLYFYIVELITSAMQIAFSDNWTVFGLQQFFFAAGNVLFAVHECFIQRAYYWEDDRKNTGR